jgi:hypothetical protein
LPVACKVARLPKPENVPNEQKMYQNGHKTPQISVNIPDGRKIFQHFPINGTRKFAQIGIFGLKINHQATLVTWPGYE